MSLRFHALRTDLPLRHPSVLPPCTGPYVRDWRGTRIEPASERMLSVDYWHADDEGPTPGFWFVLPGPNDASIDRLPWRELSPRERKLYGYRWLCMAEQEGA